MKKLDLFIKAVDTGIKIPDQHKPLFLEIIAFCIKNRGGYVRVQVSPPEKKRTTGPGSQNNHAWGHAVQIAEYTGDSVDDVMTHAKREAFADGYPFKTTSFGDIVALSQTEVSTEQEAALIESLHRIAAFLDLELREE